MTAAGKPRRGFPKQVQVCPNSGSWTTVEVVADPDALRRAVEKLQEEGWGTGSVRIQPVTLKLVR